MIEPINYTAALRRSWRLLVALAVIFAIVAVLLPVSKPPSQKNDPTRYQATAIVGAPPSAGIVGTQTVSLGQILYYGNNFFLKGAALAAAKTPGPTLVMIGAMSATPQTTKAGSSSKSSTASTNPVVKGTGKTDTGLVTLTGAASTKQQAVTLVNQYASTLGNKLAAVAASAAADTRAATSGKSGSSDSTSTATPTGYQVMVPALLATAKRTTPEKSSVTSSHKVRLLAGLVLGLIVGALVVLVVELLNKKLRLASRAEAHFKYPVVAEIPETWPPTGRGWSPRDRGGDRATFAGRGGLPEAPDVGDVRGHGPGRRRGQFAPGPVCRQPDRPADGALHRSVPGDAGPSSWWSHRPWRRPVRVVVNLGAAYAEAGQRVVIVSTGDIDAGVPAGVVASYSGPVALEDVRSHLRPSSIENVSMLSLRPFVKNSAQLVSRAAPVFDAARQIADVVLVEAPPFLQFHHGEALAHAVDVVLVVGECGETTFQGADETGVDLRRIGAPVLGVVFTEVPLTKAEKRGTPASTVRSPEPPVADPPVTAPEDTSQYPVETQA